MLSVEFGSDQTDFIRSSAGELANWDQEISFDRSNISSLYKHESDRSSPENSSQGCFSQDSSKKEITADRS